jgi:hypothetical protein
MENGSTPDLPPEIHSIHNSLACDAAITSGENSMVEPDSNSGDHQASDPNPNESFAREILNTIARVHSESVRNKFRRKLSPIAERAPEQVERICDRAQMPEPLRETVVESVIRIARKHNILGMLCDEVVVIGALVSYGVELRALSKDSEELLAKFAPAPARPVSTPIE